MTALSVPFRRTQPGFVLVGGLIAGTCDILFAIVFWAVKSGVPAIRVLQSVASGLLGKASFEGGGATAALGLGLHYFIATSMSVTYYLVSRRLPVLREQPLKYGAAYGLFLYLFMRFVVVPLSAASPGSLNPLWVVLSVLVHMFLIGVPIAWFARRAAGE